MTGLGKIVESFQHAVHRAVSYGNYGLASFRTDPRARTMGIVRRLKRSRKMMLTPLEAYQLYAAAQAVQKLPGDVAEVGVARGGSARLICEALPHKQVHLFDTFEGLPEPGQMDTKFRAGEFACTLESVRSYLQGCNVALYKGLFPRTAGPVADAQFCLVHLDVDLYQSTADCLEFFYPRMVKGGIILSHDYVMAEGPKRAFDEFFAGRPEPVLELSGNQCLTVKA
jgi:hypothetical protein